jgi:hypothetical protein
MPWYFSSIIAASLIFLILGYMYTSFHDVTCAFYKNGWS